MRRFSLLLLLAPTLSCTGAKPDPVKFTRAGPCQAINDFQVVCPAAALDQLAAEVRACRAQPDGGL